MRREQQRQELRERVHGQKHAKKLGARHNSHDRLSRQNSSVRNTVSATLRLAVGEGDGGHGAGMAGGQERRGWAGARVDGENVDNVDDGLAERGGARERVEETEAVGVMSHTCPPSPKQVPSPSPPPPPLLAGAPAGEGGRDDGYETEIRHIPSILADSRGRVRPKHVGRRSSSSIGGVPVGAGWVVGLGGASGSRGSGVPKRPRYATEPGPQLRAGGGSWFVVPQSGYYEESALGGDGWGGERGARGGDTRVSEEGWEPSWRTLSGPHKVSERAPEGMLGRGWATGAAGEAGPATLGDLSPLGRRGEEATSGDLDLDLSVMRERESLSLSLCVCLSPGTTEGGRQELQDLLLDRRRRRETEQQLDMARKKRSEQEFAGRARESNMVLARARVLELSARYSQVRDAGASGTADAREGNRGRAVMDMLGSPAKSPLLRENILREIWLERRQERRRASSAMQ